MILHVTVWDGVLMVVVTAMAGLLAFFKSPGWKAFMLSLPLPFTCATLSLGQGVGISNVAGLIVLLLFTAGVRYGYYRLKWPIVPVIALCAAGYCLLATGLNRLLPAGEPAFWLTVALVFAVGLLAFRLAPVVHEPHYRSPLPLWIKIPIIALVVACLVIMKSQIGGFMSTFPMVGLISAYEARNSLNTVYRQIAMCLFGMAFMMGVIHAVHRLLEPAFPGSALALGLGAGWIVYLAQMALITRGRWTLVVPESSAGAPCPGGSDA